jgi:phosphopantetheinyl transferase
MKHDVFTMSIGAAIHVFYYTGEFTGTLLPDAEELASRLNPARRERLAKRRDDQRALELSALRLLEIAMQVRGYPTFKLSDIDYPEQAGVTGKPRWTQGQATFSISHAHSMAMVAVSAAPVGVDAELNRSIDPKIVRRVLHDNAAIVQGLDEWNAAMRWTQVEAVMKAAGLGILHGREIDWLAHEIRLRGQCWHLHSVDCGPLHVAHVATELPNATVATVRVDFL